MEYVKITPSQFKKGLESKKNMLVFGKSGIGKTATVYEYALENGLRVIDYDLAGRLPEEVAGIPAVEGAFYKRTLDEDLDDFFKAEGEGFILLFDEVNQGSPDTLNTLYRITHPNPAMRKWAGHDISKCQIVACGNLSDGTDGTVYLTDLPTPLMNRFFVFELQSSNKETTAYLKAKYKNIPQVAKYIKTMLDANISPRDIDLALDILQYDYDAMFLEAKLGSALTAKIYDIQKNIKSIDPAEMLKNCRLVYKQFKEDGTIAWAGETIDDEKVLMNKFEEIGLSSEEIASIVKGE
jgi:hypothetical protein